MLQRDGRLARRGRRLIVGAGAGAIASAHFLLGMDSPGAQAAHVFLGALYLAPILAAASWFGCRQGVLCAIAIAAVHCVHVGLAWPPNLLLGASQAAQMSVFVIFAAVVGVHAEQRRGTAAERVGRCRKGEEPGANPFGALP